MMPSQAVPCLPALKATNGVYRSFTLLINCSLRFPCGCRFHTSLFGMEKLRGRRDVVNLQGHTGEQTISLQSLQSWKTLAERLATMERKIMQRRFFTRLPACVELDL